MLEQFAFAIAFDRPADEQGQEEEARPPEWLTLVDQITTAISEANLPALDSNRWEDFGWGRVFWGTKVECEAVKQVLSGFPVYIWEDRNLDAGYYESPTAFYYVNDEGEITSLLKTGSSLQLLGKLDTIPMDAYQIQAVDSEVERQFMQPEEPQVEEILEEPQVEQPQIEDLQVEQPQVEDSLIEDSLIEEPQVEEIQIEDSLIEEIQIEEILEELQVEQPQIEEGQTSLETLSVDPTLHDNSTLEIQTKLQTLEQKLEELYGALSRTIDPEEYNVLIQDFHNLQQHVVQYANQLAECVAKITELEQQQIATLAQEVRAAGQQLNQLQVLLPQRSDRAEYESLQEQLQEQSRQRSAFESKVGQEISRLQAEVKHWQAVAATKIEVADYQALQQQVANQSQFLAQLSQHIQGLDNQMANWQALAANKIDRIEYETALSQLKRLMVKKQQSWLSRVLSWFRK
uniref:Uncharacterized protein n=1 Tax=Cyanothece sp. (strain PCC 7425 / ATCC 29141) TaxID=395961 RepID=B8HW01_CYAP4